MVVKTERCRQRTTAAEYTLTGFLRATSSAGLAVAATRMRSARPLPLRAGAADSLTEIIDEESVADIRITRQFVT